MNQEIPGFGNQSSPDFKRLLLAGLLTFGILSLFNVFFAKPPQKQASDKQEIAKITGGNLSATGSGQADQEMLTGSRDSFGIPTPELLDSTPQSFEIPVTNHIIERDAALPKGGYLLTTQDVGASISALSVFGYESSIPLLEGDAKGLFLLRSRSNPDSLNEGSAYKLVESDPDHVIYERVTKEGLKILRKYRFSRDNYLLDHEIEVQNVSNTRLAADFDLIFRTVGEGKESSLFSGPANEFSFLAHKDQNLNRHLVRSDLLGKEVSFLGTTDFMAFEQRYFLVSVLPKDPSKVEKVLARAQPVPESAELLRAQVNMELRSIYLDAGQKASWEFSAYVGPKQLGLLKMVGHDGLEDAVNFGWFGVISRPLLWLLVEIYDFVHNFGIAIILLTLLVKLLTFPLTQKSFISMQQMKKIQPEVKALEKKYGHDRATLSQKQMELYRERGVNPLAGCLPMFLQFPIWIALYQMLSNSIEIFQKPFAGWIVDLTLPDPYYVLPISMGVSMVIQQLLQPMQDDQKAMKYAMMGTSVLFTYIMISLPSGLSLYMFTNNILTLVQQYVIKRRFEKQTA